MDDSASTTDETGGIRGFLYRELTVLRGSFLLSTVAIGFALLVVAALLDSPLTITRNDGVIAGMLGVFAVSAILVGGASYLLLNAIHRH